LEVNTTAEVWLLILFNYKCGAVLINTFAYKSITYNYHLYLKDK
jgi:hypothetical protein